MSNTFTDPIKYFVNKKRSNRIPSFMIAEEEDFFAIGADVFRSYYCNLFYVRNGKAEIEIGSNKYSVEAGNLIAVGPGLPYHWLKMEALEFDAIIFNEVVFKNGFDNSFFFMLDYFCPDSTNIIKVTQEQGMKVSMLFETLKALSLNPTVVPGILHALLMLIQEHYILMDETINNRQPLKQAFVSAFRALLAQHYIRHRTVSFYASELHISPKYLSEILVEQTGWSAKKWIEYHLIVEAKTMLSYSKLPIKEVAYQLGYGDVSHFTKAFKKWTQLTPGEFA